MATTDPENITLDPTLHDRSAPTTTPLGVPWHLWVVGVLALLWNAFGALDYVMTATENVEWLARFTPEQREYFQSLPAWAVGFWAIGVWGGVLGAVLLLARSRFAIAAFAVSLIALIVTIIWTYGISDADLSTIMGPNMWIMSAVIFAIALFELWYARTQAARGVLR